MKLRQKSGQVTAEKRTSYGKKPDKNIKVTAKKRTSYGKKTDKLWQKKRTSYGKKVDLLISYPKTEQIIKIVNKTLVFLLKTH